MILWLWAAIDTFIDEFDLCELGFTSVDQKVTGRPSYHAAILFKLYVYCYLNTMQSNRQRNKGQDWLLLAPKNLIISK